MKKYYLSAAFVLLVGCPVRYRCENTEAPMQNGEIRSTLIACLKVSIFVVASENNTDGNSDGSADDSTDGILMAAPTAVLIAPTAY